MARRDRAPPGRDQRYRASRLTGAELAEARRRRRRVGALALGALATVALLLGVLTGVTGGSESRSTLDSFLGAWEGEDYEDAAALTDARPRKVGKALAANRDGLDGASLETEVVSFEEAGEGARAGVAMSWDVPGIGRFDYQTEIELRSGGEAWQVQWTPKVVHPELAAGERLGTVRDFAERAPILDRRGRELVEPRPVVDVGVVPGKLEDRGAAVAAIAGATEADPKRLRRAIRAAKPKAFVTAITLREEEFEAVSAELTPVPGIELARRETPLAPSREFARALLGAVGPITAEQLGEVGAPYGVGDQVGQWGLQAAFERQLAGDPTRRVVVRSVEGVPVETLMELRGVRGEPLRTRLDAEVQAAAEQALGDRRGNAALVVLEPSSGDVLAVANRRVEDTFNRALEGNYPPGSAFKVITTAALLEAGLDPDETVSCPERLSVEGKLFTNFEGGAEGAVPFRRDFTESCNTAFVSLTKRLAADALGEAARDFGLGASYDLPVEAFAGSVPPGRDAVERAAAMIGQARILASPLAMAGVAATVAEGRWRGPRLLASDPERAGPRLESEIVDELRSLMRGVVEAGTGTALAEVRGKPAGKSGTAEYEGGDPPPTHAWFIAFRGDLAIAAIVEDAPSGGTHAAPVVAEFLAALDRGG